MKIRNVDSSIDVEISKYDVYEDNYGYVCRKPDPSELKGTVAINLSFIEAEESDIRLLMSLKNHLSRFIATRTELEHLNDYLERHANGG